MRCVGRAAVEIERQPRLAEFRKSYVTGAEQADFFFDVHRNVSGGWGSFERRMASTVVQQDGRSRSVVGAEARFLVGADDTFAFSHRARTHTDGHGVYVCGKHPPRAADRARQFQDQIADLAAERRAAVCIIE